MKNALAAIAVLFVAGCAQSCYRSAAGDVHYGFNILIPQKPNIHNLADYNIAMMDGQTIRCSGVVVLLGGTPHIVTAAHCIYDEFNNRADRFMFKFGKTLGIAAHIKDSPELDLAVFVVEEVPSGSVLTPADICSSNPDVGDVVFVAGNPGGMEDMVTHGIVSKVDDKEIYVDGNVWFGNSGGGLFGSSFCLLGISQRMMQPGNYGLFSTNDELRSFLGI